MNECRCGHYSTVKLLISQNADVNKINSVDKHTALSYACSEGYLKIVKILLDRSADPFHNINNNTTTVLLTARNGYIDVIKLLINHLAIHIKIKTILHPYVKTEMSNVNLIEQYKITLQ